MDLNECACSGRTLARLVQPAVMAVLARRPLHGYLIVQELAAMPMFGCRAPDPTGVYRVLKAMEQEGLLTSTVEAGDHRPARRCYTLTADGRACLAQWADTLREYRDALTHLLNVVQKAADAGPLPILRPS